MTLPTDSQIRDLLLRRLSPAETARLEDAIILEDGVAEQFRAEELDLIADYAADRLTAAERADLERGVLAAARNRESLRLAMALVAQASMRAARSAAAPTVSAISRRPRHSLRVAAGAALLAAGLAGLLVVPQWRTLPHPSADNAEAQPKTEVMTGAAAMPESSSSTSAAVEPLAIVTLLADVDRGATVPALRWRANQVAVRLQAEVPRGMPDAPYALKIQDDLGHALFEAGELVVHSAGRYRFVSAVVPTKSLGPGVLTIALHTAHPVAGVPADHVWRVIGVRD